MEVSGAYESGAAESVKMICEKVVKTIKNNEVAPARIFLDDIPYEIPYTDKLGCRIGVHIGQRKLFLTEVQFLTNYASRNDKVEGSGPKTDRDGLGYQGHYVLYAGAAPSNKGYMLAELFPKLKFILVDPNTFDLKIDGRSHYKKYNSKIKYLKKNGKVRVDPVYGEGVSPEKYVETIKSGSEQIYLLEDLFTDELSEMFRELNPYFISDIRTREEEQIFPTSADLIWNMAMQFNWIISLKPRAYMVKFRHPFYQEGLDIKDFHRPAFEKSKELGIDFEKNYSEKKLEYLEGRIYLQAWAGPSSTESRLVGDTLAIKDVGDWKSYEDKFFYLNNVDRAVVFHENAFANKKIGFDHCNDCAIESVIWQEYKEKVNPKVSILACVQKLSEAVSRNLFMGGHGHFFSNDKKRVISLFKNYKGCRSVQDELNKLL